MQFCSVCSLCNCLFCILCNLSCCDVTKLILWFSSSARPDKVYIFPVHPLYIFILIPYICPTRMEMVTTEFRYVSAKLSSPGRKNSFWFLLLEGNQPRIPFSYQQTRTCTCQGPAASMDVTTLRFSGSSCFAGGSNTLTSTPSKTTSVMLMGSEETDFSLSNVQIK